MATLTTKARKALPKSEFAGPGRTYPIPDKAHAVAAKSRATQAVSAGRMSSAQEERIEAKANKLMSAGKKHCR